MLRKSKYEPRSAARSQVLFSVPRSGGAARHLPEVCVVQAADLQTGKRQSRHHLRRHTHRTHSEQPTQTR
jgi:hypothetical protein